MECQCILESVLVGEEAEFLRNLFKTMAKKAPHGEMLGVVDWAKQSCAHDCTFKYDWGFKYYCDNQSFIKEYVEQNKDKFPELHGKICNEPRLS